MKTQSLSMNFLSLFGTKNKPCSLYQLYFYDLGGVSIAIANAAGGKLLTECQKIGKCLTYGTTEAK